MSAPSAPSGIADVRARKLAMLTVVLGIGIVVIDGTLLNLALPQIAEVMDATPAQSIWVVNAYQLATLVCLLPFANLGDRVGYRRVYLGGAIVFAVGTVLAAFSANLAMLVLARAVQGIGGAAMMSVNAALVRLIYPPNLMGRGMALNSMVVALGSVLGPTIAAAVLSFASWRWLFAISLPLIASVLWLGSRALPDNPPARPAEPLRGRDVVFNVLMFGLVFVGADLLTIESDAAASTRPFGIAMIAAGVVAGVLFIRRQARRPAPLFPVDLMRIPVFALSMASSVSAFAAMTLTNVALPFLLLLTYGRSELQAGVLMTAWPVAVVLVAPIAGRLIGRVHNGVLGGIGMVALAAGLTAMALLPDQPGSWDIAWRLFIAGAGFALFQSPNNHTIVTSAPPQRAGAASGMLGTARLTGMTLGAVVLSLIFSRWPVEQGDGPVIALATGACFAMVAAICSSLRRLTGRSRRSDS